MSVLQLLANNAVSLLNAPLGINGNSITLQPGLGSEFPQPLQPGEFFLVTLENVANPSIREIVKIIGRAGDTLIIDSAGRGQEGTTVQFWDAHDTLVDHSVTAETMRQAFLQPDVPVVPGPKGDKGDKGDQGIQGIQGIQGPPGTGGSGSGNSIAGSNIAPVVVDPTWTNDVSTATPYSDFKRGHKFWVTIFCADNGFAETFELLAIVQGIIAANTETVDWTRTNRIGYNFRGTVDVTLDKPNNTLSLTWNNMEPTMTVVVTVAHLSL